MPYLGNVPAEAYTNTVKDSFNGDGSTTAFTLSQPSTTNNLRVVVENVIQDPTVAYSCSGTTLTFTSAPPSGTANIYAVHLGPATMTAVPPSEINNATNFTDGITVDKNGGTVITADRASSDGTIIDLQKDGSSVGSIGSRSNVVSYIVLDPRTSVKGAALIGGSNGTTTGIINPGKNDGDIADAAIDLGSTYARFKDLYLSGGVYVGGTGSANYLDDYEEGEYSPTLYGSTTGTGSPLPLRSTYDTLTYTKIGRQVTIGGKLETLGSHSATGVLSLSLPFTVADQTDAAGNSVGAIMLYRTGNYQDNPVLLSGQNQSTAYFIQNTSGGDLANILAENMDSAIEIFLSLTFFTAS